MTDFTNDGPTFTDPALDAFSKAVWPQDYINDPDPQRAAAALAACEPSIQAFLSKMSPDARLRLNDPAHVDTIAMVHEAYSQAGAIALALYPHLVTDTATDRTLDAKYLTKMALERLSDSTIRREVEELLQTNKRTEAHALAFGVSHETAVDLFDTVPTGIAPVVAIGPEPMPTSSEDSKPDASDLGKPWMGRTL